MPGKWTPAERTPGPCHSSDPLLLFLSYVSIALKLKLIGTRPKKQPVWRAEEYGNSRFWMWAKQQWRYHSAKASSRTRTERPREGLMAPLPISVFMGALATFPNTIGQTLLQEVSSAAKNTNKRKNSLLRSPDVAFIFNAFILQFVASF